MRSSRINSPRPSSSIGWASPPDPPEHEPEPREREYDAEAGIEDKPFDEEAHRRNWDEARRIAKEVLEGPPCPKKKQ